MKEGLAHYPHLVNVKTIPGLDHIAFSAGILHIGATATHRRIEQDPLVRLHVPVLAAVAARVGNARVRAVGTLGGNLCFAEPHSDLGPLLVALEARLVLVGAEGERVVPAERFFTGILQTARQPHEVLTRVELAPLRTGWGAAYHKIAFHERPTAGVAACVCLRDGVVADARIAVGSVGPLPARVEAAEAALRGRPPEEPVLRDAAALAADHADVLDDFHGGADYKRHLVAVLTVRALRDAAADASRAERRTA
jgi:carbon-monoxide dehydrogenase medium subunit